MKPGRREFFCGALLWLAISAFSFVWGYSAALADDGQGEDDGTRLTALVIEGPNSVGENSSANYTATATFSDGSQETVTTTASWSVRSRYASIASGVLTTAEVKRKQIATISAKLSRDGVTKRARKKVAILNNDGVDPLVGLTVTGASTVSEGSTSPYKAIASLNSGQTRDVTDVAAWSEDSAYAVISNTGVLSTSEVDVTQVVAVSASYTMNGVTLTHSLEVAITDAASPPPPSPNSHSGRFNSYEGAATCLPCHRTESEQVYKSEHYQWSGKFGSINDFCIYPDINLIGKLTNTLGEEVDGGCLKCHTGLGSKPTKAASPTDSDLAGIDCLVCHAPSYKRTVDPVSKAKFIPDEAAMGMTILEAATDIREPNRATCLNCHTKSGGGDNFKRGDIEEAHRNVTDQSFDVHMYGGGPNMNCTECHTVAEHRISGRGMDLRVEEGSKVDCSNCHTAAPHKATAAIGSTDAKKLNDHVKRVHCATCHIPQYAKKAATDTFRDWAAAGELNPATHLYDPSRTMQSALIPEYVWWNGQSRFYAFGTAAAPGPDGKVLMAGPTEASAQTSGAKIYPVKIHNAGQPIDIETRYLLPLKIGLFYMEGDIVNAAIKGREALGWPDNGYEFQSTKRIMGLFHEVSPKTAALGYGNCNACHNTADPRVPLKSLGYQAKSGMTVKQVCSQCHEAEDYSFSKAHMNSEHKGYDCSRCHDFSKAP